MSCLTSCRKAALKEVVEAVRMMQRGGGCSMADIHFVMDNMHGNVDKVMIRRAVRAAVTSGLLTQNNTRYKVKSSPQHHTKPCSCETLSYQFSDTSVSNVEDSSRRHEPRYFQRANTKRSFVQRPRKLYSLRTKSSLSSNKCSCDAYSSAVSGEFESQRPKKNLISRISVKNSPKKNAKFESKSHKSVYNQNKLAEKVTKNKHIRKGRHSLKNRSSLMKKPDDYRLERTNNNSTHLEKNKLKKRPSKERSAKSNTNTSDKSLKKCRYFTRSKTQALKEKESRRKSSRKSNSRRSNQSKNSIKLEKKSNHSKENEHNSNNYEHMYSSLKIL